jgi:hypothetical protein
VCRKELTNKLEKTPIQQIGYLQSLGNNIKLPLFILYNSERPNVNLYYYTNPTSYYSKFKKIDNQSNLKDNDTLTIDNKEFLVKMTGDEEYSKFFNPLYPELMSSLPYSSITPVPYYFPKKINSDYQYIGKMVTQWYANGRPLGDLDDKDLQWKTPRFYLHGKPLFNGTKYLYIISELVNDKLKPIWFYKRNQMRIGDHITLRKSNRLIGPLFLVA